VKAARHGLWREGGREGGCEEGREEEKKNVKLKYLHVRMLFQGLIFSLA
jgi:hypothetical protein